MIVNMAAKNATVEIPVFRMTSDFGAFESFRDHAHTGKDWAMENGSEIHSLLDGVVTKIVDQGDAGLGKGLMIKMENGETAIFGHLSDIKVQLGDHVSADQLVALSGSTGNSTGPHLHLGIQDQAGEFVDPSKYEAIVQSWDPSSAQIIPDPFDLMMGGLEGARDWATEKGSEASAQVLIWIMEQFKEAGIAFGKWMITVGPDTALIIGMVFCLGAICSIPKAGKWTTGAVVVALILEVIRKGIDLA